jgi:peptidylprolyl isomerase
VKIAAFVGAVLLGALLILLGALGARWLGPPAGGAPPGAGASTAGSPVRALSPALDLATVRELLAVIEPGRRREILASEENFSRFVEQERISQSVLAAAYANGADASAEMSTLMERAAQRVLAEAYLNQVVRSNLDPAFPTEEQVREAFDKNAELFRVPERIHLWQIFVPLPAEADDATTKAAWQLAERLARDLRAGKADFGAMAKQHSAHEQSRVNDGYMGLINVAELLPPIAEAAGKLAVGSVSEPIATESGLHVLKRGETVAGAVLDFERVSANLRERLRQEGAAKLREAALAKIAEEYPVTAPADALDEWRATLAAENPAVAASAPGDPAPLPAAD